MDKHDKLHALEVPVNPVDPETVIVEVNAIQGQDYVCVSRDGMVGTVS
jgi:hypothetical protein